MIKEIKMNFITDDQERIKKKFNVQLSHLREQIADLIGAYSEEITITDNTTFGLNIVLNGMKFNTGDEIITTSMEHLASISPLINLKNKKRSNQRV